MDSQETRAVVLIEGVFDSCGFPREEGCGFLQRGSLTAVDSQERRTVVLTEGIFDS